MDADFWKAFDEAFRPPMPEGKEHLVYRDIPWCSATIFEWMMKELEPYELEILAVSRREAIDGTPVMRGQIWVNQDGLNALPEALERDKEKLFPVDTEGESA